MAKSFSNVNADARPGCAEYSEIDITGFQNFTLCCWSLFTSLNANSPIAVKWGASGQYGLWVLSKKYYIAVSDAGAAREAYSVSDYDTGTWNHTALVFGGSSIALKINAGVTESVTGGTVATGISNNAETFQVGQYSSGGTGSTRFDGAIADICIFNKALTDNELLTVMRMGPRAISGLVLWFPMIDGSVADVNLAPLSSKTSVAGVNTSFSVNLGSPPIGSIYG